MGKIKIDKGMISGFKNDFSKFTKMFKGGGDMSTDDFIKESGLNIPSESDISAGKIDVGSELNSELNLDALEDMNDINLNDFDIDDIKSF